MKKEPFDKSSGQEGELKGVLIKVGQEPITEHYTTVTRATADALAQEIARRTAKLLKPYDSNFSTGEVHVAAERTLIDWFTGKWKPGGPTDPPDEAPT